MVTTLFRLLSHTVHINENIHVCIQRLGYIYIHTYIVYIHTCPHTVHVQSNGISEAEFGVWELSVDGQKCSSVEVSELLRTQPPPVTQELSTERVWIRQRVW